MKTADAYVKMIDKSTPTTYAATCREAAEQARSDSTAKEEEAKDLRREADNFDALPAAAQKLRAEAAKCEEDARDRLTWASRLDGMANDAAAKIAS